MDLKLVECIFHRSGYRADLAGVIPGADDEIVGNDRLRTNIELNNVTGLLVNGDIGDYFRQLSSIQTASLLRSYIRNVYGDRWDDCA